MAVGGENSKLRPSRTLFKVEIERLELWALVGVGGGVREVGRE